MRQRLRAMDEYTLDVKKLSRENVWQLRGESGDDGDSPDDPAGLLYYLNRVFEDTPLEVILVNSRSGQAPAKLS